MANSLRVLIIHLSEPCPCPSSFIRGRLFFSSRLFYWLFCDVCSYETWCFSFSPPTFWLIISWFCYGFLICLMYSRWLLRLWSPTSGFRPFSCWGAAFGYACETRTSFWSSNCCCTDKGSLFLSSILIVSECYFINCFRPCYLIGSRSDILYRSLLVDLLLLMPLFSVRLVSKTSSAFEAPSDFEQKNENILQ